MLALTEDAQFGADRPFGQEIVGFKWVYTFMHRKGKSNSEKPSSQGETHGCEKTESKGIPKR